VSAGLVVTAKAEARFAPVAGQGVEAGMLADGRSRAVLGARLAASAAINLSGQSGAAFGPILSQAAALSAPGTGSASFGAISTTRVAVVPIRPPSVELADDELVAILQLLAA
jgi:hypothetical protein